MDFGKIFKKTRVKIAAILTGLVLIFTIIDYFVKWELYARIFTVLKSLWLWIILHPNYGHYLLLIVLIITVIFLSIKLYHFHSTYERFEKRFGVFWDKKKQMRCLACHKLLKYSTGDSSTFFCSDPRCDNKHFLRDEKGSPITEKEAIEKMENNT